MKIQASLAFKENYSLVFENILNGKKINEINKVEEFIKAVKDTKENPYLNTFFKKLTFKVEDENKIIDKEGTWLIKDKAEIELDDGKVIIYANSDYWWLEARSNKKKTEKYFYFTD